MDCGSKGCRFKSFFLPLFLFKFFNNFFFNFKNIKITLLSNYFFSNNYLLYYYKSNEHIWQEGLLIDFLQKKIIDNWLKKFVIYSGNLFNERLLFDKIIKIYLFFVIWPLHKLFILEFNNVSALLFINFFFFILVSLSMYFIYFILIF